MSDNADIQELRRLTAKIIQENPVDGLQIISTIALEGVSGRAGANLPAITPQPSIETVPQSSTQSTGNVKSVRPTAKTTTGTLEGKKINTATSATSTPEVTQKTSTPKVKKIGMPKVTKKTKTATGTTHTPEAEPMTNTPETKAVNPAPQTWSQAPEYGDDIIQAVFGSSSPVSSLSPTAPTFSTPTKVPSNTGPAKSEVQEPTLPIIAPPKPAQPIPGGLNKRPAPAGSSPSQSKKARTSSVEPEAEPTTTQGRKLLPSAPEAKSLGQVLTSQGKTKTSTGHLAKQKVSTGNKKPKAKDPPKSTERQMNDLLKSIISQGPNIPHKTG